MRYLRVVLPLLCVREACAEPKTGAAALELDTRPLEGAPPLLDGTERGARGEPLLGPTQINQYKELQTIKMKNDAMFGEVKTINKNGRIDLTWESGKDKPSHTLPVFFSRHTSHFPYIDLTWESGKISSHTTPSVSRMSHFHFPYISPISILIRQDVFTHTCHFIYLMCHTSHFS